MARRSLESLEELPEVAELPPAIVKSELYSHKLSARDEAHNLLVEAHQLREAEARLKKIKARLAEIVREEGLEGLRSGIYCCVVRYQAGRRTLDRMLLVENGVTPEQIEMSMKQAEPSTVVELPEIGR